MSQPCTVAGATSDAEVAAAAAALECAFPPSYRTFLRRFGALALPPRLGVVDHFVGLGADAREWFCLDADHPAADGELPVLLFDARDNAVDQRFYDSFGQMLDEVLRFVEASLDGDLDESSVG